MKVWKLVNLSFDTEDEDVLRRFACKKMKDEHDVELLHQIVENIVYAIDNDSKTRISDVNIKFVKGESNG